MSLGLYIHIPYCCRKCLYCDFYSLGCRGADFEAFAQAVTEEAGRRSGEFAAPPATLYLGGGTPSLLPEPALERIVGALDLSAVGEATIEVNPEDVSEESARMWRSLGFNRVSMGVQSLCDEELKGAGRRHTAARAREAYAVLRRHFSNVSLDLIYGLPGQTAESWRRSVDGLLAMRPDHISAYALTYEPGTPLSVLRERGKVAEAPESLSLEMFGYLRSALRRAGYEHYEVSNFALPGRRAVHNSSYWDGSPYIGLGPSAHSYDGQVTRRANPADLRAYLSGNFEPVVERLGKEELRDEMLLTRLRTSDGLDLDLFRSCFGEASHARLLRNLSRLPSDLYSLAPGGVPGFSPDCTTDCSPDCVSPDAIHAGRRLRFTEKALFTLDSLILDLSL